MKTPTELAMDSLKTHMVQARHDAVEEIKDGMRDCIDNCAEDLNKKYYIINRQTHQPVVLRGRELMNTISDSEWYQHGMIELLKQNEDDAFERMTWIVEPEHVPTECLPTNRFSAGRPEVPIPATCLPVGRDQYIRGIEELGKSSLAQEAILHKAFRYLQKIPEVVDRETAAQEAQSIAKVKHFVHSQWVREREKAHHMYVLLMKGRGRGLDD